MALAMERKLAEQALKEREEIYRAIVCNAADGIVLIDPKRCEWSNSTMPPATPWAIPATSSRPCP